MQNLVVVSVKRHQLQGDFVPTPWSGALHLDSTGGTVPRPPLCPPTLLPKIFLAISVKWVVHPWYTVLYNSKCIAIIITFIFTVVFQVNPGQTVPFHYSSSTFLEEKKLVRIRFLWVRCPSCHPINCVKALKETQSTDKNQEKSPAVFIHSSSTTGLLTEGAWLPLHWLSDSSTTVNSQCRLNSWRVARLVCCMEPWQIIKRKNKWSK